MESKDTISPFSKLPTEIIHEIVKYDPGCSIKLAFTCKEMYEILQDEVREMIEKALENRIENRKIVNKALLKFF
jgi:hypothetical protein